MYPVWTPVEPDGTEGAPAVAADAHRMDAPSHATSRHRDPAEPLTAGLSRLHVTVSRRFLDELDAARSAFAHTRHGATAESILEAGLDLVLERHAARRRLVETPRAETAAAESSGGIPESVKREVWKRDGGRCQWP